ncbi:MAG: type II toxin-antitoxin system RelE/ParE family toxin [Anaerolineales bacterium]
MIEIRETDIYHEWFESLKDKRAKARIDVRIRRVSLGNFGDVGPVGKGVSEFRIDFGLGYRVYFTQHGTFLVILLCGGEKSIQAKDIQRAHELAQALEEE